MSNGWKMQSCFGAIPRPRETEAGSAGKQPAKGYLGLRCDNCVSGPCREVSTRVIVFCALDIGVMPQKIHCIVGGARLSRMNPNTDASGYIVCCSAALWTQTRVGTAEGGHPTTRVD